MKLLKILTTVFLLSFFQFFLLASNAISDEAKSNNELSVVPFLDLNKFQGTWYEIARTPWYFEDDCYGVIAKYDLKEDGDIGVTNLCRKGSFSGETAKITGKGWVVDQTTKAKLKVQFIWPFNLNYWIIHTAPDYSNIVVGEPDRENLWILNQTPEMDVNTYQEVLKVIEQKGYDISKVIKTPQDPAKSQCLAASLTNESLSC
jgi:apolipoprotein D and lipocalin family protein